MYLSELLYWHSFQRAQKTAKSLFFTAPAATGERRLWRESVTLALDLRPLSFFFRRHRGLHSWKYKRIAWRTLLHTKKLSAASSYR